MTEDTVLPNYFRRVENFCFTATFWKRLSVPLTESLRILHLHFIALDPNFEWTKFKNLMKLNLGSVNGINVSNFIEFLYQRPKFETFVHYNTFNELQRIDIFQAMAQHCGNTIRNFKDGSGDQNYNFISGLKSLKAVALVATQICCGDLFDPIKRLSENNTIERLDISHMSCTYSVTDSDINCIFRQSPQGLNIKPFSNLKTVSIALHIIPRNFGNHDEVCEQLRLFTVYSSQIFSNVETLALITSNRTFRYDWNLIQFAPK